VNGAQSNPQKEKGKRLRLAFRFNKISEAVERI
jgi:hypothetical protein